MFVPATQLKVGTIIKYQNDLYRMTQVTHITPGNWRGMVQTKMRNLRTGVQTENRFHDHVRTVMPDSQRATVRRCYPDADRILSSVECAAYRYHRAPVFSLILTGVRAPHRLAAKRYWPAKASLPIVAAKPAREWKCRTRGVARG